jgi:drug/metabolite transporter (DMT)-like permease
MLRGKPKAPSRTLIAFAFACVYIFWGSTYTAIHIGAENLPAFLLTGIRFLIAGSLMLLWCRIRGLPLVTGRREIVWLAVIGILLLTGGNASLVYSEKYLASGFASLLFASVPIYVALIEMFIPGGEALPARGWLGLLLGFAGLATLLWPSLRHGLGDHAKLMAILCLLAGAFTWATGSVLSRHLKLPVNSLVAAGWQMVSAGLLNTILAAACGNLHNIHATSRSVWAVAYLIVFGSLVGYTAYVFLLEYVPVAKVATNAYVNPVVAVILGMLILGEQMEVSEYIGMGAIILAVFLVTSAQVKNSQASKQKPLEEALIQSSE